jgi:hypothetical protein
VSPDLANSVPRIHPQFLKGILYFYFMAEPSALTWPIGPGFLRWNKIKYMIKSMLGEFYTVFCLLCLALDVKMEIAHAYK